MDRMQEISLEIIRIGIARIHERTLKGDCMTAHAEAVHLYNLPTIMEKNERESYLAYVAGQRAEYINWVRNDGRSELLVFVRDWYIKLWNEMDQILGLKKSQ